MTPVSGKPGLLSDRFAGTDGPWTRRPLRLVERNMRAYRRAWLVLLSGAFEPFFYLLGIGFGVGALVGSVTLPDGSQVPYAVFVAPALMASSAMNGAITETTYNVFFKLNFQRSYDAILATPLGPGDIALGEVTWALMRGTIYAAGFLAVMTLLGLVQSPLALLTIPGAVLVGFGFAGVGMAATTWMRRIADFDYIAMVTLPLFLLSATFFPVTVYPPALQLVVQLTPLYHGVALLRELALGLVGPDLVIHAVYLVAMGVLGLVVTGIRLRGLLLR